MEWLTQQFQELQETILFSTALPRFRASSFLPGVRFPATSLWSSQPGSVCPQACPVTETFLAATPLLRRSQTLPQLMLVSPIFFCSEFNLREAPKAAKNSSKLKPNACGENQRKHPWNPFRSHSFHHDMAHHTVATARGNNSKNFCRISQAEDIFTVYEEFPVKVLGVEESHRRKTSSQCTRSSR